MESRLTINGPDLQPGVPEQASIGRCFYPLRNDDGVERFLAFGQTSVFGCCFYDVGNVGLNGNRAIKKFVEGQQLLPLTIGGFFSFADQRPRFPLACSLVVFLPHLTIALPPQSLDEIERRPAVT